jgi:hypothetical protein
LTIPKLILLSFRAYLLNLLSFGQDNKTSFLESQGWKSDTTKCFEPYSEGGTNDNLGFNSRAALWREDQVANGPWRPGVNFTTILSNEKNCCNLKLWYYTAFGKVVLKLLVKLTSDGFTMIGRLQASYYTTKFSNNKIKKSTNWLQNLILATYKNSFFARSFSLITVVNQLVLQYFINNFH